MHKKSTRMFIFGEMELSHSSYLTMYLNYQLVLRCPGKDFRATTMKDTTVKEPWTENEER